jgi:ribose transport system permease protein
MTTTPTEIPGPEASSGPAPVAATVAPSVVARVLPFFERYALAILFVLVFAFFSFYSKSHHAFPTKGNLRNIAGNQAVNSIVALAAIVPLIAGQFDFSVGAVLELSSIGTAAALSRFGAPLPVAILVGVGLGMIVGVINGLLVAKIGVNPFITTLGMATLLSGVVIRYTGGQAILKDIPHSLTDQGSKLWLGVPRPAYFLLIVALLVWYLLGHTPYGRYLHSVGSNAQSARLVGLNVDRIVLLSFVLSGTLAGLAGVLQVARQGAGNPGVANAFVLPAFAAAFLGATVFRPGRFNVWGTVLAVYFVSISTTGLTLSKVGSWVEPVFQGGALIVAVALSTTIAKRRGRA